MDFIGLCILGLIVGVFSSFFGLGGGVIVVPGLMHLFPQIPQQVVTGTSLSLIALNSAVNLRNFIKSGKNPDWKIALNLGLGVLVGAVLSGQFSYYLSQQVLRAIFGATLLLVTLKTLFFRPRVPQTNEQVQPIDISAGKMSFAGLLGGLISGLTGLGGGVILVPLMMSWIKIPIRWLSVYSQAGMLMGTAAGSISFMLRSPQELVLPFIPTQFHFAQIGSVNLGIAFFIFLASSATSKLGVKWNNSVSAEKKNALLSALFIFLSLKILYQVYSVS